MKFADLLKLNGRPSSRASQDASKPPAYPTLAWILTREKGDDDKPREMGKVSIRWDSGLWNVCVVLPTEGMMTFFEAEALETLWDELELHLGSTEVVWRETREAKLKRLRKKD